MVEQGEQRRLAAIFAADMVGYSRLMETDERGTITRQKIHRAKLIDPKIAEHHGRIVKTTGDGMLVEFASVVDAVECAVAIQDAMVAREKSVPEGRRIQYRVGINLGDIIVEDDDIFGDGVNIAARLEGLANPGGICISRAARDQIRDKLDYPLEDLGEVEVKNITRPIRVFRVLLDGQAVTATTRLAPKKLGPAMLAAFLITVIAAAGVWWWQFRVDVAKPTEPTSIAVPAIDKPSIAVLPFTNMSGDPEQEYFSDGITEDIITDLSKISGLFVVARNSSFQFRGRAVNLKQVGRELGIRYVLEGSVRRSGQAIRINAQLIDTTTGGHLWADRYDGSLVDVFALQDEVTRQIVRALAVQLNTAETINLSRKNPANPEAYDLVLRGLELMRRYTRQTMAESREYFTRAIALDPNYARAHADMAVTYANDLRFGWTSAPEEIGRIGLYHAQRALAIDESVREVHFARGMINLYLKRYDAALDATRKSIEVDSNYADGQAQLAFILNYMGQPEQGLKAMQRAIRLNPLHDFNYLWVVGQSHFYLAAYDEAAAAYEEVVKRNPESIAGHKMLAATYARMGRIDDAQWAAAEILTLLPDFSLAEERARAPYKNPQDLNLYIDALAKAGLPE